MRYLLLLYSAEDAGPQPGTDEQAAEMEKWFAITNEMQEAGVMLGGEALEPSATATSIQVRDGQTLTTDGPFAETTPWGGKPFELPLSRRIRYKAMRLGAGKLFSTPQPTKRVVDADVLELGGREWVSVHTPGHTEDHLCLWDQDNGVMISGDHILPTITPHISGMTDNEDPLSQFFDSLERMRTFENVSTVLPAHGLAFEDLAGRAGAIASHHHDRLEELRKAGEVVGEGTVEDYMKQLFKPRSWGTMAESETYAHLQHLQLRNQADTNHDGTQLRFSIRD